MVLGLIVLIQLSQKAAEDIAPTFYKAMGLLTLLLFILVGGIFLIYRTFRQAARDAGGLKEKVPRTDNPAFVMATFQGVIKQMREQEKELERLHQLERQRAEESQQLAATIMRNMATGLVMLNSRGIITECNPAAKIVLGHQLLVGRSYRETFWPDYHAGGTEPPPPGMLSLEDCLKTGSTVRRMQMTYRAPNSQNMVLGIGFSPIRAADGTIGGAILLLTDLTEITALQQEVRLKEHMAALGEMAAGIAHEFKNSLATISGYSQLLESATLEETHVFAAKIVSETQFLAKIVNEFLNFSRPLSLVAAQVDTRRLVEDSFAEIHDRGKFPGVTLEMTGEFPTIQADATLLRQAFSNLLRNGCEAIGDKKAGRLLVQSHLEQEDGRQMVKMNFQDEGGGIEAGNLDKVFIPFFTTKNSGTGLGLPLVHKIVVNHNGKIAVENVPGMGASFTVTLPLTTG